MKGFQETGGAIIVGYRGNPKLENEILDSSLSPSGTFILDENNTYGKELEKLGFVMPTITGFESFNFSYHNPNPTPREYLVFPVDEKINIYQKYDDSLYNDFIKEAKRIFKE